MDPILELRDVSFGYGKTPVLYDINLHLHPGQFAGVVGPSGAGKTSLLRLALGALSPTQGQVRIDGNALNGRPAPRVSCVPQVSAGLTMFQSSEEGMGTGWNNEPELVRPRLAAPRDSGESRSIASTSSLLRSASG